MNRKKDVKNVIQTIDDLLQNKDVKLEEIKNYTNISRVTLSQLRNGHKPIRGLSLEDAEKLCELSDKIKRGSYIPDKVKTRLKRQENDKKAAENRRHYDRLTPRQQQMLQENGIDIELYYQRKIAGWTFKEIVNRPVRKKKYLTDEEKEILKRNNIPESTFHARIARGWNRQRALNELLNRK